MMTMAIIPHLRVSYTYIIYTDMQQGFHSPF